MAYHKTTTISGYKAGYVEPTAPLMTNERYAQIEANRPFHFVSVVRGHWKPASALALARRAGCIGDVDVTHNTNDMSGHGRGGYDRAFVATDAGVTERDLTAFEREYSDADDVNEISR